MTIRHIIVDDTADAVQDAKNSLLTEDAISGATYVTNAGILKQTGNLLVNTDKFVVTASTGATAIAGAATLASTLGVTGDVAVNTDKFTIAAGTGNTVIAGTGTITGAATLSSTAAIAGGVTIGGTAIITGNTTMSGTATIAGNTTIGGTAVITGNTTMSGDTSIGGDLTLAADCTLAKSFTAHTRTVAAGTDTVLVDDFIILVGYTATGACTVTIPTAQCLDGRTLKIADSGANASTNNITIATEGAETISGGATAVMNTDNEAITLVSDGTNWFIV